MSPSSLLCALITVYWLVLLARILLSWFPIRPGTPFASVYVLLRDLTEPVLAPLRRVIPPVGMLDISSLVLIIGLVILRGVICS
ncbi:MAG: YggT family protein [Acidimicrobiia bacterium]